MAQSEIRDRLIQKSQALPDSLLLEVIDFMEFVSQKREASEAVNQQQNQQKWRDEFRTISTWPKSALPADIASWKIEEY